MGLERENCMYIPLALGASLSEPVYFIFDDVSPYIYFLIIRYIPLNVNAPMMPTTFPRRTLAGGNPIGSLSEGASTTCQNCRD